MTIKTKLLWLYGMAMSATLVMAGCAVYQFQELSSGVDKLVRLDSVKLATAGETNALAASILATEQSIMVQALMHDRAATAQARSVLALRMGSFTTAIEKFRPLLVTPEGKSMVEKLSKQNEEQSLEQQEFLRLIEAGSNEEARALLTSRLIPMSSATGDLTQQFLTRQKDRIGQAGVDLSGTVSTGRVVSLLLSAVCLGLGGWLYIVIGKLDTQLRLSAERLTEGAEQVTSAATQVSSSSQSLARDTSEQAAMIEETSASAEEINSMARRNSESAQSATTLVVEAVTSTEQTNLAVADCVLAMDAIGESSSKIAKTLQVIDKIAFQTNRSEAWRSDARRRPRRFLH